MSSSRLVSLEQYLKKLEQNFITVRSDYTQYTAGEYLDAVAYRVLASAALEDFVEKRCLEVAAEGCDRLSHGKPTATGRALIVWSRFQDRRKPQSVYIRETDPLSDPGDPAAALKAYTKLVRNSHGINADDLRGLVFPLGLSEAALPVVLTSSLDSLADSRNPASHAVVKNRKEPASEVQAVNQILLPLRQLDSDLQDACVNFHP